MSLISDLVKPAHPAELVPDDHVIVLFGATGDLAQRKLLPGLFRLATAGLLPLQYQIVAISKEDMTDDGYRQFAHDAIHEFSNQPPGESAWTEFAARLSYTDAADPTKVANAIQEAEDLFGSEVSRLHYLSVPPAAAPGIVQMLGASGLHERARVIMEKPFGSDLTTARSLNRALHTVLEESQIFRIDHFLRKEAVQNLFALRFANPVFEVIWNRDFIDYVQIDVPETLSIGTRAEFYEATGAFRDMVVTHLLQVLSFVAMEPPESLHHDAIVDETTKVFEALRPLRKQDVIRGQYRGYIEEPGVAADSATETFVALRAYIDNPRWQDVPFFMRTGKRLAEMRKVVTIGMKEGPYKLAGSGHGFPQRELVFDLGEPASISTHFLVKGPGPTLSLARAPFAFHFQDAFAIANQVEPYERLIHDALIGDRTLFTSSKGIELLWEASADILDDPPRLHRYAPGSWGPREIRSLIQPYRWHQPVKPPAQTTKPTADSPPDGEETPKLSAS